MTKLKLDVEKVTVVSFPIAAAQEARGKVQAFVLTPRCLVTGGVDSCWCTESNCP